MEQTYDYDEFITNYIRSLNRDMITKLYLNIFNNIDKLNKSNYFKEEEVIELDLLELDIREIITTHEESVGDDLINIIVNKIISYITKCLYKQSITLDTDIRLSELDKVIEALLTVIEIDPDLIETITDDLTSDEYDITLSFINILLNYSDLTLSRGMEIIDNVGYDFKVKTLDYLRRRKNMKVDNSDFSYLVKIINLDNDYGKTNIVKDFIRDGYEDVSIEFNIDNMYTHISSHKGNINLIAHEIAATLFLSSDTRNSLEDSLETYVNFESLGFDNNNIIVNLKTKLSELINELEMRL